MRNIFQINLSIKELQPGHGFSVCVHCDLYIRDMFLGQGHDTSFGQLDKKNVKYYPNPTWQRGFMALTQILGMYAL